MQEVQNEKHADAGLRARKRAATHARIQAEAMRLFLANGFEATTLDEVAVAAGVSRRTLLNYFGSKEEIVFSTKAEFPQWVADAVAARPADEPMLDMVENALFDLADRRRSEEARAVAVLIAATPSLRAGDQAKCEAIERLLASTLAKRKGLPDDDVSCRVVACATVSIIKLSTDAWLANPDRPPETFGREAFAALRGVVG